MKHVDRPAEQTITDAAAPSPNQPEHGADSQLHCYNAVSWRLAEMFGEDNEPEPQKPK